MNLDVWLDGWTNKPQTDYKKCKIHARMSVWKHMTKCKWDC